ncbi:MAG: hypothetical protein LUE12_04145 [Ruminococcus sp.]|nr:hypothetical protein [Ruminococcus sp.]
MKLRKSIVYSVAAVMAISMLAGCSGSDDSSSESSDSDTSSDAKVDVYMDSDGYAYYYTEDGTKMMLYSYEYSEEDEDDTSSYIYDYYDDENGLTFTIPDGWYADDSYGYPYLFVDGDDSYNEIMGFFPTTYIFDADEDGNVGEDVIVSYYEELVEDETYTSYELTETGETTVGEYTGAYYDVTASYESDDDEEESFRTRYIITEGDNSFCIMLMSLDDDDSFATVTDAFDEIYDTVTLPTTEQLGYDDEEEEDTEDEDTEEDDADEDSSEEAEDDSTEEADE